MDDRTTAGTCERLAVWLQYCFGWDVVHWFMVHALENVQRGRAKVMMQTAAREICSKIMTMTI